MNQHPEKFNAVTTAQRAVRACAGAVVVGCALFGAAAAWAGPGDPPRKEETRAQPAQPNQRAERDPRSFEARAEEHRRTMQESANNAEMTRRVGRMTADERRDLRRQINEASQEVYSLPPRR